MTDASRHAGRHPGVLARGRPRPLVQARRRLRRRSAPALSRACGRARPRANCRHGKQAMTARWRSSSCSTSFPATCSATTRRTYASDALAREVARRAIERGVGRADRSRCCANSSICRSCIRSIWPTSCAASSCSRDGRPCREPEMGRAPRRHHPPVRPLSPPQPPAGPRDHAGGAGLPGRRRLFAADDGSVNGRHALPFRRR